MSAPEEALPVAPLDAAWEAVAAEEGRDGEGDAWFRFWRVLAGTTLHLVVEEGGTDPVRPRVYDLGIGPTITAFDSEDRLAGAIAEPTEHVALAGRDIAAALAGQGVHLALNPGAGGAETVIDPGTLAWLAETFGAEVTPGEAATLALAPPREPEPALLEGLGAAVGALRERVSGAWLAAEGEGYVLVVEGADSEAAQELVRLGQMLTARPLAATTAAPGSPLAVAAARIGIGLRSG